MNTLLAMFPSFALNLVMGFLLIGFVYYPTARSRQEYIFTFFVFNLLIYFVAGLLRDVQMTIGFGFGLLAVFSTLHYRTSLLPMREATFLFICISVPFINQLFMATRITFAELLIINVFILVFIYVIDRRLGVNYLEERQVIYEKIDMIRPENYTLMLNDLRQRTGLDVQRWQLVEINFLRDVAIILIYYKPPKQS